MQIAAAAIKDARAIAEIHVAAWQAAYAGIIPLEFLAGLSVDKREAYWREEITRGRQKLLLAKEGNALIGSCQTLWEARQLRLMGNPCRKCGFARVVIGWQA